VSYEALLDRIIRLGLRWGACRLHRLADGVAGRV
jgi:hypothetical protein